MSNIVHHPSPGAIGQAAGHASEKPYGARPTWREASPGLLGEVGAALRFLTWAQGLRVPLTVSLIVRRWGMHRATAYRWLAAYRAAKGEA